MSNNDNIIRAFPALPDNPVTIEPRPPGVAYYCQHEAIRVDPHARTLHCAQCGQALDPFDYVHGEARALAQGWSRYREVKREVNELIDRVDVLKKEEKRLKAAIRRAQDKAAETIIVRGKGTL